MNEVNVSKNDALRTFLPPKEEISYLLRHKPEKFIKIFLLQTFYNNFFADFTLTGVASNLIFLQDTASSGLAPLSDPSNSLEVFRKTLKSAPFL